MAMASAGSAENASVHASAATAGGAAAVPKAKAPATPVQMIGTGRRRRPAIDLDHHIERAREAAKEATKALGKARTEQRNERRKKARLLKKAGQLSAADLERIAVLKRTGFWDPSAEDPREANTDQSSGASGSGAASTVAGSDVPDNPEVDDESEMEGIADKEPAAKSVSKAAAPEPMQED